jgi:alpha-N-arabinofuranosidase
LLAKKGFTQWTTDMIFFDNVNILLTPNYYVQKMFMTNQGDTWFDKVILKNESDTTLAASCVQDRKSGDIILKMVNYSHTGKTMKVNLAKFGKVAPQAEKTILSGQSGDENTFENFEYITPPMSLTVIRIKKNLSVN